MIVELVGLPGSGKSTFARRLAHQGTYTKIGVTSTRQLLWCNCIFAVCHPVTFFRLLILYIRYAGPRSLWYTKFMSVFLDYNAKYILAKRVPYALLDQGHTQVLLSLFESVLPSSTFEKVVRSIPVSDHYIFFDISEGVRQERLTERGYVSRKGIMDDALRTQWQETAAAHFRMFVNARQQLAPATFDVITESEETDEVVARYVDAKYLRYITFARMPTEKAHGLQIAKMCEAFIAQTTFTSLVTPKRSNEITQSVTEYYNLENEVTHFEAPVFDVTAHVKTMRRHHHYLHELLFAWYVFRMPIASEIVIYTRTALVVFVLGLRGKTVIAEQHFWPNRGTWMHRYMLSFATSILCNSEGTKAACIAHGLPHATVAHNGFEASIVTECISKTEARKNLNLPVEGKVIMYIGSLGDWKGVDTLAEAAINFADDVITVVIGGSGGEVQEWCVRYPHVRFLGMRPYDEIGQHQRAADILVVPNNPISKESREYTSPIKLFAHMASGVPILVSDLASLRNIVSDDQAAFFTAGDTTSLCDAVNDIFTNPDEATRRAQNALETSTEYTWDSRAKKIIKQL